MKELATILLLITASLCITSNASAQNPIPSYNVPILVEPTTFEEGASSTNFVVQSNHRTNIIITNCSEEERKMVVKVIKPSQAEGASAVVYIYSLDEQDILGPFTVTHEAQLEQAIDEREWGVEVVSATEGCEISTWIE